MDNKMHCMPRVFIAYAHGPVSSPIHLRQPKSIWLVRNGHRIVVLIFQAGRNRCSALLVMDGSLDLSGSLLIHLALS